MKIMDEEIENNKLKFINLLTSTNRKGINNVIKFLEESDFFIAPASTKYHENYDGGLCEHSLKVYKTYIKLVNEFELEIDDNSIIIMCLLHDICKTNCYIKSKKNEKIGQNWMTVDYYRFDDANPIGHGHKSVIMLLNLGLELNELEINSIVSHMNGYDKSDMFNSSNVYDRNELTIWLHVADFIATYKERNVI